MDGVSRPEFLDRTGVDLDELAGPTLRDFVGLGLLADDGRTVRLTRRGLLVSDSMWERLL